MKNIIFIITVTLSSLVFSGCSGSGGEPDYIVTNEFDDLTFQVVTELDNADSFSIQNIKNKGNTPICSTSIATYQYWTDDSYRFDYDDIGNDVSYDIDKSWVNINSYNVQSIMLDRIERASNIGCEKILFTDIDNYNFNTGFFINEWNMINFTDTLISEAHWYGMEVGSLDIDTFDNEHMNDLFDFIIY